PFSSFSITLATDLDTSSADAPGYVACMEIVGGATSGYCETGMLTNARIPANVIARAITHANTGRSIKNCGIRAHFTSIGLLRSPVLPGSATDLTRKFGLRRRIWLRTHRQAWRPIRLLQV